jgi:sugar/nucleoside kinase (ribokinase family)
MSRILVMGELNADLVMTGLPSLPVLGRELVGTGFRIAMGSSSAITAARLAALGAQTDFVGRVGGDDLGRFVTRELHNFGVGVDHLQVIDAQSDVTIALTYEHDRALLTYSGLMTTFTGDPITPDLLAQYDHLHVGSFALQTALQPQLPRIFRLAHEIGLTTSLDMGWDPYELWMKNPHLEPTLAEADFFFPNETEAEALCGEWNPEKLAALVRGTLAIKLGAKGGLVMRAGSAPLTQPSFPVEVVDTTGAGDAFNAGFLYTTLAEKADPASALRFAVACGAEAVTHVGGPTAAPTASALRAWLKVRYRVEA